VWAVLSDERGGLTLDQSSTKCGNVPEELERTRGRESRILVSDVSVLQMIVTVIEPLPCLESLVRREISPGDFGALNLPFIIKLFPLGSYMPSQPSHLSSSGCTVFREHILSPPTPVRFARWSFTTVTVFFAVPR